MASRVEVTYFTDPYCSWCWATEPMLYRIRETFRDQVRIRYVMGGLVRDMAEFYDALNDIRTAAQVAPHWRMVSQRSGQPIDEGLWLELNDPHFSTWPACIAVKAAFLQGEEIGERLLRRFRRAALTERRNISRREVQEELAREVEGLDLARWRMDLENGRAARAFEEDLEECRRYGVTGFPTLLSLCGVGGGPRCPAAGPGGGPPRVCDVSGGPPPAGSHPGGASPAGSRGAAPDLRAADHPGAGGDLWEGSSGDAGGHGGPGAGRASATDPCPGRRVLGVADRFSGTCRIGSLAPELTGPARSGDNRRGPRPRGGSGVPTI